MNYKTGFYSFLLTVVSTSVSAAPFALEGRSLGMGNVGVATADIATAPFANPAMLAFQRRDDDFSLLIGLGAMLNDPQGVIDDVDNFQAARDQGAAGDAEAIAIINQLQGKVIAPELSAAVAVGFAGDTFSMAVSARSDVLAAGTLTNIDTSSTAALDDPTNNILEIQGVQTTEVGLSIASNFDFLGPNIAIGLTPKIVSVDFISVSEPIVSSGAGAGDFLDEDEKVNAGEYETIDVGIVIGLTDSIQIGVVAQNIIANKLTFEPVPGTPVTLKFDRRLRGGIAYKSSFLTLGVDMDLTETDSLIAGNAFSALKSQQLSIGAELNAFDFAQLRVGMMQNIADGIPSEAQDPVYTAGVGFWLGFNLDVAVVSGEGDSLGAFVQTGFRF